MSGGPKFPAKRTEKTESSFRELAWNQQLFFNQPVDGDQVSQFPELLVGRPSFHPVTSVDLTFFEPYDMPAVPYSHKSMNYHILYSAKPAPGWGGAAIDSG